MVTTDGTTDNGFCGVGWRYSHPLDATFSECKFVQTATTAEVRWKPWISCLSS